MRVIAGISKGKRLYAPRGLSVRPTQDKVKGAIFNMLGDSIIDKKALDLYCGSGALGIEALSRGAETCVFVDTDTRCVKKNLALTGFNARVVKGDVIRVIKKLKEERMEFDIILADPPYNKGLARNLLSSLERSDILPDSGFVVIEHSKKERIEIPECSCRNSMCLVKEKRYGDTVVTIFRHRNFNIFLNKHSLVNDK